jgi:hypothetical protein
MLSVKLAILICHRNEVCSIFQLNEKIRLHIAETLCHILVSLTMKRILAVLGLVMISCFSAVAQNRSVTGVVADADNKVVVSATVKVKGVSISAITDAEGKFTVSVPAGKATLAVSSIGFVSKTVEVAADQRNVTIVLAESTQELGEVVVTALGIKKQKKSLGYAVQEIKGN